MSKLNKSIRFRSINIVMRLLTPRINSLIIIVFCSIQLQINAQTYVQNNINALVDQGLENVKAFEKNGHFYLTYENNRFRFEADALEFVIKQLSLPKGLDKITVMIQNRGIGIVQIKLSSSDLEDYNNGVISGESLAESITYSLDIDDIELMFEKIAQNNSSYFKADAIVGLDLDYFIGDFTDAIRQKVNIQPCLSTVLGRGTAF